MLIVGAYIDGGRGGRSQILGPKQTRRARRRRRFDAKQKHSRLAAPWTAKTRSRLPGQFPGVGRTIRCQGWLGAAACLRHRHGGRQQAARQTPGYPAVVRLRAWRGTGTRLPFGCSANFERPVGASKSPGPRRRLRRARRGPTSCPQGPGRNTAGNHIFERITHAGRREPKCRSNRPLTAGRSTTLPVH